MKITSRMGIVLALMMLGFGTYAEPQLVMGPELIHAASMAHSSWRSAAYSRRERARNRALYRRTRKLSRSQRLCSRQPVKGWLDPLWRVVDALYRTPITVDSALSLVALFTGLTMIMQFVTYTHRVFKHVRRLSSKEATVALPGAQVGPKIDEIAKTELEIEQSAQMPIWVDTAILHRADANQDDKSKVGCGIIHGHGACGHEHADLTGAQIFSCQNVNDRNDEIAEQLSGLTKQPDCEDTARSTEVNTTRQLLEGMDPQGSTSRTSSSKAQEANDEATAKLDLTVDCDQTRDQGQEGQGSCVHAEPSTGRASCEEISPRLVDKSTEVTLQLPGTGKSDEATLKEIRDCWADIVTLDSIVNGAVNRQSLAVEETVYLTYEYNILTYDFTLFLFDVCFDTLSFLTYFCSFP